MCVVADAHVDLVFWCSLLCCSDDIRIAPSEQPKNLRIHSTHFSLAECLLFLSNVKWKRMSVKGRRRYAGMRMKGSQRVEISQSSENMCFGVWESDHMRAEIFEVLNPSSSRRRTKDDTMCMRKHFILFIPFQLAELLSDFLLLAMLCFVDDNKMYDVFWRRN